MCCSHSSWCCFISFTMFCVPVFFPNTLILFFFGLVLVLQISASKILSVLLLNVKYHLHEAQIKFYLLPHICSSCHKPDTRHKMHSLSRFITLFQTYFLWCIWNGMQRKNWLCGLFAVWSGFHHYLLYDKCKLETLSKHCYYGNSINKLRLNVPQPATGMKFLSPLHVRSRVVKPQTSTSMLATGSTKSKSSTLVRQEANEESSVCKGGLKLGVETEKIVNILNYTLSKAELVVSPILFRLWSVQLFKFFLIYIFSFCNNAYLCHKFALCHGFNTMEIEFRDNIF